MARELEFAFGDEMPQAPELGANYFQDPLSPFAGFPGNDAF